MSATVMALHLAADPRVHLREGVNARALSPSDFDVPFDVIAADLSFISLTLVLPALSPLLHRHGDLLCLVKPQFEVGAGRLDKGGVVRDPAGISGPFSGSPRPPPRAGCKSRDDGSAR